MKLGSFLREGQHEARFEGGDGLVETGIEAFKRATVAEHKPREGDN